MARADDDERRDDRRARHPGFLRFLYGAGLLALGACLGIVIGSLSETPRLLLERLRGPVETVDVATSAQPLAATERAAPPLERFGELQEGKAPRPAKVVTAPAKPPAEAPPPPALVPAAELPAPPPVATAPPRSEAKPPAPAPAAAESAPPAPDQPHLEVVQVASYVDRKPADELVVKLKDSGFDAYLSQPTAANGRFRVRIRPNAGESASGLAKRLRGFGFDTWATSE